MDPRVAARCDVDEDYEADHPFARDRAFGAGLDFYVARHQQLNSIGGRVNALSNLASAAVVLRPAHSATSSPTGAITDTGNRCR